MSATKDPPNKLTSGHPILSLTFSFVTGHTGGMLGTVDHYHCFESLTCWSSAAIAVIAPKKLYQSP